MKRRNFLGALALTGFIPGTLKADNRDDLISAIAKLRQQITDLKSLPRSDEITAQIQATENAITELEEAANNLPPDLIPVDPDYIATVTDSTVTSGAGDVLPRIAPEYVSIQNGEWHDESTWLGGEVPGPMSSVRIEHHVTFGVADPQPYLYIEADGPNAKFELQAGTVLNVHTIVFMRGAWSLIGSVGSPIPRSNPVKVNWLDMGLLPNDSESEMSHGLIVFDGHVRWYGEHPIPWVFANGRVRGNEPISVAVDNVDWQNGDDIVVGATRQIWPDNINDRTYLGTGTNSQAVWPNGQTGRNHSLVRKSTGDIAIYPPVGNLSRAIIFESPNPDQRGQTMFTGRTDFVVIGCRFRHMGRTLITPSVRLGNNQAGRYPVHAHHCHGPVPELYSQDLFYDDTQWVGAVYGCSVDNDEGNERRWGITIHGSSFIDVVNNVVFRMDGSCINTEQGQEWKCRFANNFCAGSINRFETSGGGVRLVNGLDDTGGDGSGIWLRSTAHWVLNNVVAGCYQSAYNLNGFFAEGRAVGLPAFPGDKALSVRLPNTDNWPTLLRWKGNIACSCGVGVWMSWRTQSNRPGPGDEDILVDTARESYEDTLIGHCALGAKIWHEAAIDFTNWTIIGNDGQMRRIIGNQQLVFEGGNDTFLPQEPYGTVYGFAFVRKYEANGLRFQNCHVEGVCIGYYVAPFMRGPASTQYDERDNVPLPEGWGNEFYDSVPLPVNAWRDSYIEAYAPVYVTPERQNAEREVTFENSTLIHNPNLAHLNMNWNGDWIDPNNRFWSASNVGKERYIAYNGDVIIDD